MTYGELDRRSDRLANALTALGLGRGDRVAALRAPSVREQVAGKVLRGELARVAEVV